MSKVMKTVDVPARKIRDLDHIACDLCGTRRTEEDWPPARTYERNQVEVVMSVGNNYPDGGSSTETVLDICPTCFTTKLVEWFKSQGGKPRTEDRYW